MIILFKIFPQLQSRGKESREKEDEKPKKRGCEYRFPNTIYIVSLNNFFFDFYQKFNIFVIPKSLGCV